MMWRRTHSVINSILLVVVLSSSMALSMLAPATASAGGCNWWVICANKLVEVVTDPVWDFGEAMAAEFRGRYGNAVAAGHGAPPVYNSPFDCRPGATALQPGKETTCAAMDLLRVFSGCVSNFDPTMTTSGMAIILDGLSYAPGASPSDDAIISSLEASKIPVVKHLAIVQGMRSCWSNVNYYDDRYGDGGGSTSSSSSSSTTTTTTIPTATGTTTSTTAPPASVPGGRSTHSSDSQSPPTGTTTTTTVPGR